MLTVPPSCCSLLISKSCRRIASVKSRTRLNHATPRHTRIRYWDSLYQNIPQASPYKMNADNPARIAPVLIILDIAPPSYGLLDADGLEPPPTVWLGEVVPLPVVLLPLWMATRVKFAQVKRVLLLVWMTTERFPKNEAGPLLVDK